MHTVFAFEANGNVIVLPRILGHVKADVPMIWVCLAFRNGEFGIHNGEIRNPGAIERLKYVRALESKVHA